MVLDWWKWLNHKSKIQYGLNTKGVPDFDTLDEAETWAYDMLKKEWLLGIMPSESRSYLLTLNMVFDGDITMELPAPIAVIWEKKVDAMIKEIESEE